MQFLRTRPQSQKLRTPSASDDFDANKCSNVRFCSQIQVRTKSRVYAVCCFLCEEKEESTYIWSDWVSALLACMDMEFRMYLVFCSMSGGCFIQRQIQHCASTGRIDRAHPTCAAHEQRHGYHRTSGRLWAGQFSTSYTKAWVAPWIPYTIAWAVLPIPYTIAYFYGYLTQQCR